MWCVPTAVAALTGWNRERVWLDILAERHERGVRRLTNLPGRINEPHGGLHAAEALRVLERAGFTATDLWPGTRRMTTEGFLIEFGRLFDDGAEPAQYLILQRMHLAHLDTETWDNSLVRHPDFPIAKAWRIERTSSPVRAAAPRPLLSGRHAP